MTVSDPLVEALFRSTAEGPSPRIASAAPVRQVGTRSRAGNAMNRTRVALLAGAARAVEVSGTRITMAQVAAAAGVAKATLYNHFRTREAVLSALVEHQVETIAAACLELPLPEALTRAATLISRHPVLRALARTEPAALAALGSLDYSCEGWRMAADAVTDAVSAADRAGGDLVLRWLASFVLSPGSAASIAGDVELLVAALPPLPASPAQESAVG
jgi:AcrR family transcriptional regulator